MANKEQVEAFSRVVELTKKVRTAISNKTIDTAEVQRTLVEMKNNYTKLQSFFAKDDPFWQLPEFLETKVSSLATASQSVKNEIAEILRKAVSHGESQLPQLREQAKSFVDSVLDKMGIKKG